MRTNLELMSAAKASLRGKWNSAALMFFLLNVVLGVVGIIPLFGPIVILLLTGIVIYGVFNYFLELVRLPLEPGVQAPKFGVVFEGLNDILRVTWTFWRYYIFIALWSLLLIVPGIIKMYSYSMTFFILRDNPQLSARDAIGKSCQMMDGHKMRLFCLHCRFIGWILLAIITFGIAGFWVFPYVYTAMAHFYEDLRDAKPEEAPEANVAADFFAAQKANSACCSYKIEK